METHQTHLLKYFWIGIWPDMLVPSDTLFAPDLSSSAPERMKDMLKLSHYPLLVGRSFFGGAEQQNAEQTPYESMKRLKLAKESGIRGAKLLEYLVHTIY